MNQLQSAMMNIAGHADIIGKEEYNIKLSERRARAVYAAMIETGITVASQVTYQENGPDDPPYDNTIPEGRALNRTVMITIMYPK